MTTDTFDPASIDPSTYFKQLDVQQLTTEEAIALAASGKWKQWTDKERFVFQIRQRKLSMDFDAFHRSAELALNRPVWTHEFAQPQRLLDEFLGKTKQPTMDDIINLIPEQKRLIFNPSGERGAAT